ncbi:MAG: DUF3990 domain-containing protein [Bacilli bacterium]|nr:DUF3990 domain-containing protein [Bacilli bacterium]
MKSFDLPSDSKRIREILNLSQEELAKQTGLSFPTINTLEKGSLKPSHELMESIYGFAYSKLRFNKAKEMVYRDGEKKGCPLLFHGSGGDIIGNVDCVHSLPPNDFGNGFYLGETLQQAATWVADREKGNVYCFFLEMEEGMKTASFSVGRDWMYAILYYRGALARKKASPDVKRILDLVESSDYIRAPIADNSMYDTLESFARGEITDEACLHALSANNLGFQYVLKSERACSRLRFVDRFFLCEKEKADYRKIKKEQGEEGRDKMRLSLVDYRRKGKYYDELLERI